MGRLVEGPFATNVPVLSGPTHYYRCYATNAAGEAWAPETIEFCAKRPTLPVLPVTATSPQLWLDASQLTGLTDGQQMDTWPDASGSGNNATRDITSPVGYPQYKPGILNDHPVVRFSPDAASRFDFTRMTDVRSVFWVLKETVPGRHFLLGDGNNSYDFHRAESSPYQIWTTWSHANIKNGTTKLIGDPSSAPLRRWAPVTGWYPCERTATR